MILEPHYVAVACHDAGGAEMVSSWVRRRKFSPQIVSAFVAGPAVEIFNRKLPDVPQVNIIEALKRSEILVCGTGATGWELAVWNAARVQGVRTAAFIDHWKNYPERFQVQSGWSLPQQVWTTDRYACEKAKRELPGANVVLKGNPFIDDVAQEVRSIEKRPSGDVRRVLVVYDKGQDICHLSALGNPNSYKVRNRPHPADMPSERPLAEDIAWADTVVGWDSMALVAAYMCGRDTYSVLPPEERSIPYPVEYLPNARVPLPT